MTRWLCWHPAWRRAGQVALWGFLSILPVLLLYKGGGLRGLFWPTGSHLPACIGIHIMPAWVSARSDSSLRGCLFLTALSQAREVFGAVYWTFYLPDYVHWSAAWVPKQSLPAWWIPDGPDLGTQTHSWRLTPFLGISVNTPSLTSPQTPLPPASSSPDQAAREGSDSRSVGRSRSISTVPEAALKFFWSKFRVSVDFGQWTLVSRKAKPF